MFTCSERRNNSPFRVSIHDYARAFVLKLEGPFSASDAPEVEARWRTAASMLQNRELVVDLTAATSVEPAARDLLVRMYESGAAFVAEGPSMVRLAGEITGVEPKEHVVRKRALWRPFEDFPAMVACLFMRVRALAG